MRRLPKNARHIQIALLFALIALPGFAFAFPDNVGIGGRLGYGKSSLDRGSTATIIDVAVLVDFEQTYFGIAPEIGYRHKESQQKYNPYTIDANGNPIWTGDTFYTETSARASLEIPVRLQVPVAFLRPALSVGAGVDYEIARRQTVNSAAYSSGPRNPFSLFAKVGLSVSFADNTMKYTLGADYSHAVVTDSDPTRDFRASFTVTYQPKVWNQKKKSSVDAFLDHGKEEVRQEDGPKVDLNNKIEDLKLLKKRGLIDDEEYKQKLRELQEK